MKGSHEERKPLLPIPLQTRRTQRRNQPLARRRRHQNDREIRIIDLSDFDRREEITSNFGSPPTENWFFSELSPSRYPSEEINAAFI